MNEFLNEEDYEDLKNYVELIRKTSLKLNISEPLAETIVARQKNYATDTKHILSVTNVIQSVANEIEALTVQIDELKEAVLQLERKNNHESSK